MRRMRRSMTRVLRHPWRARLGARARGEVPADLLPALRRAHAQLEAGQAAEAAVAFSDLAAHTEQADSARGGWMHLQAARAWNLAGDSARAADHARRGLDLLRPWFPPERLARLARRIADELSLPAFEVETGTPDSEAAPPAGLARSLPPKCPQCGATVRPDEAEPLSDGRTACAYCGSILVASSPHG